jgi:hypothetical protein
LLKPKGKGGRISYYKVLVLPSLLKMGEGKKEGKGKANNLYRKLISSLAFPPFPAFPQKNAGSEI